MKASKKLLLIVAGLITILLVISLIVLRRDIKTLKEKQTFIEYQLVPVESFSSVDFSSNWIVQVKQGKDCKVELAIDKDSGYNPTLDNKNETLYFSVNPVQAIDNTEGLHARVTAPFLHFIKAKGNTEIVMKNYWSDSLTVVLSDSSTFSGKNNDFTKVKFKASGKYE